MADRLKPGVAIVGGGWAGLAAAVELVDAGFPVTVHEAARQLGGRARTIDWHGLAIDNGQHLMAGAYRQTLDLMRRLGTLERLERRRLQLLGPTVHLALPGWPAPFHLAAGLLTASGLSLTEKLAASRFMRNLSRQGFRLDADQPADEFLRQQGQNEALTSGLWEPICVAALNTPLAEASAQVFCNVLRDSLAGPRSASDMVFNRADMARLLPDAARGHIEAHGGQVFLTDRIAGLRMAENGFRLIGPEHVAARVIIATHPSRVPELLSGLVGTETLSNTLRDFSWQAIATLWLRFAEPRPFPYPMLALGRGDAPWAFERDDLTPGLVAIVASTSGPHLAWPRETLRDHWLDSLSARVGPLPELLDWRLVVEKRATFACRPNLRRPDNRTGIPGLYLAGDYTAGDYPATLEGAVRSGVECARLISREHAAET